MRVRKKPVELEAVRWDVSIESEEELRKFGCKFEPMNFNPDYLMLETLEGKMQVSPFSVILKGVKGEYWAIKPDIFELTYEILED